MIARVETVELQVDGMDCQGCVKSVTRMLYGVAGVASVDHDHDGAPHGASHDQCDSCVEHCASASVVAAVDLPSAAPAGSHRIVTPEHFAAGFVPDPLDPPPLSL